MDFKSAIDFIYSFKDWERGGRYQFDLSGFKEFLKKIGSPHFQVKRPVLIAGTKGKSSTARILSSIFELAGKTGTFTSPHLMDIRERIKINDKPISEGRFVEIIEEIKPNIQTTDTNHLYEPTTFEILTSIAFVYFATENTDSSVFEVGLGGRLDATNVLNPEISVITPISFDHTEILGNTLSSIAYEKCGIIREEGKVISAPQSPEVLEVIKEVCRSKGAKLVVVGQDVFCEDLKCDIKGARFKIAGEEYSLPLLGRHQVINALAAIYTAQVYGIPQSLIKKGVSHACSPGRIEVIDKNPWVVFDGAHNPASAWVLRRSIVELFDFRRLFLVFGVLKDKDKEGIIKVLAPITDSVFVTSLRSPRSADSDELLKIFKQAGVKAKLVKSPIAGLESARNKAGPQDLILATGSLYLIGELLSTVNR